VLDSQFDLEMGSTYLLAHGNGKPVADATTIFTVPLPDAGEYKVWVRAKDWVPNHHPGRFTVRINGKPSLALTIWTGAGCLHYPGDKKYDFRLTAWTWDERAGKDYDIPFRSLYSKNIKNLMMAGKHISVTYVAGSSTKLVGNGSQHAIVDGCCRPSVQPISKTAPRYRYESHAGASDRYCWHHWSGLWQRE